MIARRTVLRMLTAALSCVVALEIALRLYNDETRKASAEAGLPLINLARELPKNSTYFSDWIHFTAEGATMVGDIIFRHLEPKLAR